MAASQKKPSSRKSSAIPTKGHVEPSARVFTDWTEARIRYAELSANNGNLWFAAELCEWLLTDDRIASTLWTRVQTLLGLTPTFESSGDGRRKNRAVKALEAGEDYWEAYPETELALLHMWGLLLGVAPASQSWEQDRRTETPHWLAYPEFWHPQHLRQDARTKQWFIKVATEGNATASSQEVEIVPGAPEWMLHMPYGKNRPYAWGLWRPLSRMTVIKHLAQGDWSRAGEKGAILALEIAMEAANSFADSSGKPKDTIRQLATDIYNRGRNGVAGLPPGVQLKAVDTVTKAKELYESPIQLIDAAIAILIRGGNLGTLVEGGSKAATEAQQKSTDLPRLRFDAQSLTTTVHDQSLVHWADFNYGDRKLAPWPVYPVEPEEDLKRKVETDEKALANVDKAETLGFDVDRQKFLDEHKMNTWCKPGERPKTPATTPDQNPADTSEQPNVGDEEPKTADEAANDLEGRAQNRAVGLASGASEGGNRGFVEGQLFVDALVDNSAALGRAALKPTLDTIFEELDAATDYDDLRERLRRRYENMSAEDLSELMFRTMLVAELAGRRAVTQDS